MQAQPEESVEDPDEQTFLSLDDRLDAPLESQLISELWRIAEWHEHLASDIADSWQGGSSDKWAVVIRFDDERPDYIACRCSRHATARACVEKLKKADGLSGASFEITSLEEGEEEIKQETNGFQSACWSFQLKQIESQLKVLRCKMAKANSVLKEPAA